MNLRLNAELVFVVLFVIVHKAVSAKKKDLQIIEEFKPDDCSDFVDNGDHIKVHYTGYLDSGVIFDSSRKPDRTPLPLVLGQGQVITGWEKGIKGMCVGEKRKLIIPPELAYGKAGHPPTIPADATLTFDVELMSVDKKPVEEIIFKVLRFLAVPVAVMYAVYYLYGKYKKTPTKKDVREGRRGKKKAN